MTVPQKIQLASQIVTQMTANIALFPTPNPALAAITTAAAELDDAYDATELAKLALTDMANEMNGKEADLDQLLTLEANYVNNVSGGDANIIMKAAMAVAAPPTPQPVPEQVIIQTVTDNSSGKLDMKWKKVKTAKTYTVQQNTDINDPTLWTQIAIITKTKYLVTGLTSGTKYWFRVQAVGTAGEGPWSDPYVKYAP